MVVKTTYQRRYVRVYYQMRIGFLRSTVYCIGDKVGVPYALKANRRINNNLSPKSRPTGSSRLNEDQFKVITGSLAIKARRSSSFRAFNASISSNPLRTIFNPFSFIN